jgi:hypothetical protein
MGRSSGAARGAPYSKCGDFRPQDELAACTWCGRPLPRHRTVACKECVPEAESRPWEWHTVVGPRDLLKADGTLMRDPRYGATLPTRKSDKAPPDLGFSSSGTSQREELARWLASCGLSAEEIADHLRVESLGVWRRAVTVATVRRWAGSELRRYTEQQLLVLASHPLINDVRQLRAADLPSIMRRIEALRDEYGHTRSPAYRILLEECDREMQRVRVKSCEQCNDPFLAKRRDARFCKDRCQKAHSRANVGDNRPLGNIHSISRGDAVTIQVLERHLEAQDRTLHRLESTLSAIAETLFANRVPASVFGDAVEALIASAQLDEEAA